MDVRGKLLELLDEAEEWADHKCDELDCETCPSDKMKGNCVQQLMVDRLIANGVTVQEWISVKDRLPEKREDVLLCRKWWGEISNPKMGWYNEVSGKWFDLSNMEIHNVTYWMPLPQPPKGE